MTHRNRYTLNFAVRLLICTAFLLLIFAENICAQKRFHIGTPKLGLGLIGEFDNERITGPDTTSQSERIEFRERLEIEANGWMYHPAFMTYDFNIIPEFVQRTEDINTEKGTKNSFLQGYFFNTKFLPYKPYTLTLFGQKQDIPQTSPLTRTSDQVIERIGGTIGYQNRVLPTYLNYTQTKTDQTGFFNSKDKSDQWRLTSRHKKGKSVSRLEAMYEQRVFSTSSSQSEIESLNNNITNNYDISGDGRITLNSNLSQRITEDDKNKSSGITLLETLGWRHRKNLTTNYSLTYTKNTSSNFFNEETNLGAGLTHGLYENLTTNISGNAEFKDFTGGNQKSYAGDLNFNYLRPIPWGNLGLNMRFNYRHRSNTFTEDFIPVIDESHILTIFDVTLLDNKFIDIGSIKVTDITGTTIYIENFDYSLREANSFVRISRIIGGRIADGENVLVSYRYLSDSSYDDATLNQVYGFNLDLWSTLFFSYQYGRSKQKLLSGILPNDLEDDTTHTANLELLWKFSDTIFSYDKADRSSGNSTERWRVEEILTFRPIRQVFLRFRGNFAHFKFTEGVDESEDAYGLGCIIDWMPKTWAKLGLSASHLIRTGESVDSEDTAITAVFEMTYYIWNGSLRYTFINENDRIENETRKVHNILFEIIKLNF